MSKKATKTTAKKLPAPTSAAKTIIDSHEIRRLNMLTLAREANSGKERGAIPALAKRAGVSTNYLYQLSIGERNIGDDVARQLEDGLQKPAGWMDHLHDAKVVPTFTRELPVFDMSTVLAICKQPSAFNAKRKVAVRTVLTDATTGARAFALVVEGDAMEATAHGSKPTFPMGVKILVDPDRTPEPGRFVVARVKNEIYFRKLTVEGKQRSLIALNSAYPKIDLPADHEICGVVIQKIEDIIDLGG